MQQTNTESYFDCLRGIAIFFVVGIHCYLDDVYHVNLAIRQLLNCAVPLFLAISGYFIGQKDFSKKNSFKNFFRKQFIRVYVPMILWSIPWVLLSIKNAEFSAGRIFFVFIGGISVFYFIPLIIQCYAITPVIQKFGSKLFGLYIFVTFIGVCLFVYLQHVLNLNLPMIFSGGPIFMWLVFYAFGVLKGRSLLNDVCGTKLLVSISLCLVLNIVEIKFLSQWGHTVHGIKISAQAYSLFLIMLLFSKGVQKKYRQIEKSILSILFSLAGRFSFVIYLSHCLVITIYTKFYFIVEKPFFFNICKVGCSI